MSLALMTIVLSTAAFFNARRSGVHSRLMLLVLLDALTLAGIAGARDIRVHGRPHPAYLYGGGFIALGMLARSSLNRTEAWYAVADALRTLVH